MHTTDFTKRLKIFTADDLPAAVFDEPVTVEIYAKNITWEIEELNGNLLLRGEECHFPNLTKISGSLSVDAANCSLPSLKTVEENFTLHCPAHLDQLKTVRGFFKCIIDFDFKSLETVGGSISLKKSNVTARNKRLVETRIVIPVKEQYDVKFLPQEGIFNIDIFGSDIIIPHNEIRGKINVYGKNVSFPYLEFLQGQISIECRDRNGHHFTHDFPVLKMITGHLKLDNTKVSFPELQEIKGNIQLGTGCYADFPLLENSGSISVNYNSGTRFPMLKNVDGNLQNQGETCHFISLEKVKGTYKTYNTIAPRLQEAGNLEMHTSIEFEHLKRINGKLTNAFRVNFKSLEYVNYYGDEKQNGSKLPALKEINFYLYQKEEHFEHLAKNIYFKVNDRMYLSKDKLIISGMPFNYVVHHQNYSIRKLVAILKLRHSSFQNFITREYERQWPQFDTPFFTKILERIEKLWNAVETLRLEELFESNDRNLRLFCFNYVGVGNLMNYLNAEKINEEEIDLHYNEYDHNGNKTQINKTNRYELYKIENRKLGINTWREADKYSYAVKCWCPSTKKEHWLWVEQQYSGNALIAIASTFRIHENIIPYIRCLKRQGDLLICELEKEVIPRGFPRALTVQEYFNLLEVET
ncbi:hypothetical protein ACM46_21570 [Chryseobacterium angstadtii]|uniref:Uncharacterized protein n=1 Tax=Chryseobacterium angstadtii TaxID=558151 RepID=A0A0J7KMT5_9FLAO|nr:hypothetical protein [Chryseobacterium angstadtii]KMQ58615.1 hypothetical protein ACM46_21570 [Chryseobacterium angstadtii]